MASNVLNVAKMDFIVPVLCDLPPLTRRRSVPDRLQWGKAALRERASTITARSLTPHVPTVTKHTNVLRTSAGFPTPVCRFGQCSAHFTFTHTHVHIMAGAAQGRHTMRALYLQ